MRIYLIRHGESQANLLHEISNRGLRHGLTPKGREQAETKKLLQRIARQSLSPGGRIVIADIAFPSTSSRAEASQSWAAY